jgi:dCTP deaminase
MILSAQSIRLLCTWTEGHAAGQLKDNALIEPFIGEATQAFGLSFGLTAAGYDIRVGEFPNPNWEETNLHPGDFQLVSSLERIRLPDDLQAIVHDKSTLARQGLAIQNTVLEPGWEGYITLELSNHGRKMIKIRKGQPIAQLVFHMLDQPTIIPYKGKYQNQGSSPVPAVLHDPMEGLVRATEDVGGYPYQYNGLMCADCGEPQFETASGVTCKNGHGGAEGVEKIHVDIPEGEHVPNAETEAALREPTIPIGNVDQAMQELESEEPGESGSQFDEFPGDNDASRR